MSTNSVVQETIEAAGAVITQTKRLSIWRDASERDRLMRRAIALLNAALDIQEFNAKHNLKSL